MHGWHPRAIDKQVYNKNGPNPMGSIEDFASGTYGLLALNTIQGEGGDVFVGEMHISPPNSSSTPGVFYTYFYNYAHRLRLEKLLQIELSRSPNGFFKVLLDPGGGFTSETAERRFQK
jgi:hypothetical protein